MAVGGIRHRQSSHNPTIVGHKGNTDMGKAVDKFMHDRTEKLKSHKTKHDVERLHHMVAALFYMRDYPQNSTLASDLGKEIAGISAKQAEQDAKEAAEEQRAYADAQASDAADAAKAVEEAESPHGRAASRASR